MYRAESDLSMKIIKETNEEEKEESSSEIDYLENTDEKDALNNKKK
jgi:hypothetical protein